MDCVMAVSLRGRDNTDGEPPRDQCVAQGYELMYDTTIGIDVEWRKVATEPMSRVERRLRIWQSSYQSAERTRP